MNRAALRTTAIVLRRTNYGEADRILNLLTPEGQLAVKARGVRKEKSKLAGGIEMFCLSDVVIHQGRSELGTLTAAKMLTFYEQILADIAKLEFASEVLKRINAVSQQVDNPRFFDITKQTLAALQANYNLDLVKIWFEVNLKKATGEEINLVRDKSGAKLMPEQTYAWDAFAEALMPAATGQITADHIKLLRLMCVVPIDTVVRVVGVEELLPPLGVVL